MEPLFDALETTRIGGTFQKLVCRVRKIEKEKAVRSATEKRPFLVGFEARKTSVPRFFFRTHGFLFRTHGFSTFSGFFLGPMVFGSHGFFGRR